MAVVAGANMEQVWADTTRTLIDHWFTNGMGPYFTMFAALALAVRAAFLLHR